MPQLLGSCDAGLDGDDWIRSPRRHLEALAWHEEGGWWPGPSGIERGPIRIRALLVRVGLRDRGS